MSATAVAEPQPNTGPKHPVLIFLSANFVYLFLVHAWALQGPMQSSELLLKCLLLYGCMVGVFFLTRAVVKGPWWLGSLAAVLMMANPLKTEAVLAMPDSQALMPALFVIWGVLFAVWPTDDSSTASQFFGLLLLLIASLGRVEYSFTPVVVLCLRACSVKFEWTSTALWVVFGLSLAFVHGDHLQPQFIKGILTLCLVLYPIGLESGTVEFFDVHSWAAALTAAGALVAWLALWRLAKHPAIFWCGVAALAVRVGMPPIDLVNMQGGGAMILPIALLAIGFAAVCRSAMSHPQWPRHIVFLTTVLCLVFFALQIRAIKNFDSSQEKRRPQTSGKTLQ